MLEIIQIPVLQDNYLYLIHDGDSGDTAIVDPAVKEPVLEECAKRGWTLTHILNTHHHWDHTGANKALKAETGCTIIGFDGDKERIPGIDVMVREGDTVSLGSSKAHVIEVPGHTSGHIAFYFAADQALFVGDTIFAMGCGRLFEGSPEQMWDSIQKLMALPDDTVIYCAHEYSQSNAAFALTVEPDNQALTSRTKQIDALRAEGKPTVPFTLATEKATNPFMRPMQAGLRSAIAMLNATDTEVFARTRQMKDDF